jgi:predicted glycoside hydrolase/deacetylase ChbG (UPF0249 family)
MSAVKRLVVTADDFGLSPGVVEGIVEAHRLGIVTSTSLMVNAPSAPDAFLEARRLPSLATGLHFVLTFGRPVGPREPLARLLAEDGRFRGAASGVHRRARPDEVREELRAQLRLFEAGCGRPPTHIDGHHHVHLHAGIFRVMIEEAGRLGIPVRSIDDATRERLRLERIRTCDRFLDGFYGEGEVSEEKLAALLESVCEGTSELMCHPSREDAMLPALSGYVAPRYEERVALTSKRVLDAARACRIELVPMTKV